MPPVSYPKGRRNGSYIESPLLFHKDSFEPPATRLSGGFFFAMGDRMKRFFVIIFALLPLCAFARTMCVRDNTLVVSLDSNMGVMDYSYDTIENMWWLDTVAGRIYGEGTCLSEFEGLGRTSDGGKYYGVGDYSNTFINVEPGLIGYDSYGNERIYCWCRMTHPAVSRWIFHQNYTSNTNCHNMCTHYCGHYIRHYKDYREALFSIVGL